MIVQDERLESGERESFDPYKIPLPELAGKAQRVLCGVCLPDEYRDVEKRARLIDNWLRWGQSDDPEARKRWAYLAFEGRLGDRDRWLLGLWRSILENKHPNHPCNEMIAPWLRDYYQSHFFGWFLRRFDVQSALAVFIPRWLSGVLHYGLALVVALVAFANLKWSYAPALAVFLGLLGLLLSVGLVAALPGSDLKLYAYFNSLIPRLGAAVGIGYVFLFSAPHLVQMLNASQRPQRDFWLSAAALIVAALLYLMFHISRRVYPRLSIPALLQRSFSILLLAVAYSALELLIAAPLLFSIPFLCGIKPAEDCNVHADLHRLALCAAIALNLGVILQLAWDEQPLTEPL
jgi:hypothetical protein